jgi:hypothetical protein
MESWAGMATGVYQTFVEYYNKDPLCVFSMQMPRNFLGMVLAIHWTSHPYVFQENGEETEIFWEEYLR